MLIGEGLGRREEGRKLRKEEALLDEQDGHQRDVGVCRISSWREYGWSIGVRSGNIEY